LYIKGITAIDPAKMLIGINSDLQVQAGPLAATTNDNHRTPCGDCLVDSPQIPGKKGAYDPLLF